MYDKPVIITKESVQEKEICSFLEELHQVDLIDDRCGKFEEEKKRFEEYIDELEKGKDWEILMGVSNGLSSGYYGNLFPDYLLKIFAPFFFKKFPSGKIWFLPFNENAMIQFMTEETILTREFQPSTNPFVSGHSLGLDFNSMMGTIGLEIPMFTRFPNLQGSIVGSSKGIVCFAINEPISIYKDNIILHEKLLDKTKYVYSDSSWEPFSNSRSIFKSLDIEKFSEYFEWYIETLNVLYDFILRLPDIEIKRLISFSLARICFDTYLIQLIEQPYLRKILFLNLLDKYANMINGLGSNKNESQIWKNMLSHTFFENNLKSIAEKVPIVLEILPGMNDILQRTVGQVLHSKYDDWSDIESREEEAIDLLRTYRNSNHGYLINNRSNFFEYTGDIPNYLPDYALDLWHTFLADPQDFVNKLK